MNTIAEADLKFGILLAFPTLMLTSYGLVVSQECWEKFALSQDPTLGGSIKSGLERVRILGTRYNDCKSKAEGNSLEPNCSVIRHWAEIDASRFKPLKLSALENLIQHRLEVDRRPSYLQEVSLELRVIKDVIAGKKFLKGTKSYLRFYDFFEEVLM